MRPILWDHLFCHLADRGTKIPAAQPCRPQERFFSRGHSSHSWLAGRPLSRRLLSLGTTVWGAIIGSRVVAEVETKEAGTYRAA